MCEICMPNFNPLASMVWEEEEVTDERMDGWAVSLLPGTVMKILNSPPRFAREG